MALGFGCPLREKMMRNRKVFDDTNPNPMTSYLDSINLATEITNTCVPVSVAKSKQPKLVSWNFPGTGKLKLNTDGSSRGNPGKAGFGGVIRDDRGCWILGFYGRLEDCSSLEAELWGIFRGLELVQSQNMEAVEVDSDSTTATTLINEGDSRHSPYAVLKHILREGNHVADKLANIGVDQEDKWVSHISPPDDIIPLLEADMRGVAFERM